MGNFDFVAAEWPEIGAECRQAESYLSSDPNTACLYGRRAVELLVDYLYDLLQLPEPSSNDLNGLINAPAFQRRVSPAICTKLNLIRRLGNRAAHPGTYLREADSYSVLSELFHVMVWAGLHHSSRPAEAPRDAQFDATLARASAPLSRAQVQRVVQRFREQDAQRQAALAASEERVRELEEQLATKREQIAAAQAAQSIVDTHDYREDETRDKFIDMLLHEAGWPLDQQRDVEYPVTGLPQGSGNGRIDYVLWGADGLPLALVEAKRTRRSPHDGQEQARQYADALERQFGRRPMIFYTNGYEHWLWDDAAGYPPRAVQGFFTADELELRVQRRSTQAALSGQPVNNEIAGRYYQRRAIEAVDSTFDARRRQALLVMATGSGKTRTVIALVQQLQRANWVKRVLFLADREALVGQAEEAFVRHLPDVTTVNLLKHRHTDGRVYISTYQTMLNLINEVDDSGRRRFGPGYFDLIIVDEAHRSVYAKYGAIFTWFDALLVGLTATPKDEVDHNTYQLFELEDGVPTDAYSLDEAVRDGYLVPPIGVDAGTRFTRTGIRYADLTDDEKDEWDALDWGEDGPPDEVGSEELNRFLFNADTVDKVLGQLMAEGYRVDADERLAKTIIFAKNKRHAEFIEQRFNAQYPGFGGTFARTITHGNDRASTLIKDFGDTDKAPHIAISVDMLDTGIDIPDVANLVFFKLVRSKSKFWQMIGRGTRLRPDLFGPGRDKENFFVFDYCGNLEYFSQDLPGSQGSSQVSLTQRIVETRIGLLRALDAADTGDRAADEALRLETARTLHEFVTGMNLDNVLVRPHRREVEHFSQPSAWDGLDIDTANEALRLAGLPSASRDTDEKAKRFDLLMLRGQLAALQGDLPELARITRVTQEIASALLGKTNIPVVAPHAQLLEQLASDEWWIDVTPAMLEAARIRVRELIRLLDATSRSSVYSDFEDTLAESRRIDLPGTTPGTDFERFRAKARSYLRSHEDQMALQRLQRNKQLTDADLAELGRMLVDAGATEQDVETAAEQSGGLGLFVRSLVGLDRTAAVEAFAQFLDDQRYSINQIRFVNMIVNELTRNGVMEPARLFESPFTDDAPTGPDFVFPNGEAQIIVDILQSVNQHAQASVA